MIKPVDHNRPDATLITPSTETPRKRQSEVEPQLPPAEPNDVVLTPDNVHQRQRAQSLDGRDVAQRLAEPSTKRQKSEPQRLPTPPNLPPDVDSRELSLAFVRHGYKVGQAPGVTQAMRAFCPQEPNATAVRTLRDAFARVEAEGNLPQFLHICQGMRLN